MFTCGEVRLSDLSIGVFGVANADPTEIACGQSFDLVIGGMFAGFPINGDAAVGIEAGGNADWCTGYLDLDGGGFFSGIGVNDARGYTSVLKPMITNS